MRTGWLLRDGDVLCTLEMTDSSAERRSGLRGRDGCEGALHLDRTRAVHTFGMSFPIDVAFLSGDLTVVRLTRLRPWRYAIGGRSVRSVVEAEAGSFERWVVRVGDQFEVREAG